MNLFLMGVVGLFACGEKENDTSNTDTGEETTDTGEETTDTGEETTDTGEENDTGEETDTGEEVEPEGVDNDNDGFTDLQGDCDDNDPLVFPRNLLESTTEKSDTDSDGIGDRMRSYKFSAYDSVGRNIQRIIEDYNGGNIRDKLSETTTYTSEGKIAQVVEDTEEYQPSSSYENQVKTTTYEYDSHGRLLSKEIDTDKDDENANDQNIMMVHTISEENNSSTAQVIVSTISAGVVTSSSHGSNVIFEYDDQYRQTRDYLETFDTDGVTIGYYTNYDYEYDVNGNKIYHRMTNHNLLSGTGTVIQNTMSFDDAGNKTLEASERYTLVDNVEIIQKSRTENIVFNAFNEKISRSTFEEVFSNNYIQTSDCTYVDGEIEDQCTKTRDDGMDQTIDLIETELRTFDQNGNVAMYVYEKDEGADSIITSRKTWTYTYDEQDREIELRREIDQDADGTIDELYLITTVYDDASNSYTQTTRADNENDGVWDSEFSEQRTYDEDGNLIRLHAGNIEKTYTWVQLCY